MNVRKVVHGEEARLKLLEGVDAVANPVKATMGARGRIVFTSYRHGTKDGVTVARDVELFDDPLAAHGAMLMKSAAIRTCDIAGDGTTATCVLAQSLIREGYSKITRGTDAQQLKRELESAKDKVVTFLKDNAEPTTDVRFIANVSANDEKIGALVAEAVEAVGAKGVVTVENTYDKTKVEIVDGMQIDKGVFLSSFLTDLTRRKTEYEDVAVLLFDYKVHDIQGLVKAIEPLAQQNKAILIIANDYEPTVLRSLELSKLQGGVKILPIKSPNIYHQEFMEDLAEYTGATILEEADGFNDFSLDQAGHVRAIISSPERTILQADKEKMAPIQERIKAIYADAKHYTDAERRKREQRASRLEGKMAIIRLEVDGTDEKQKEIKDRIEDAIFASQAALEMGIVAGGGMAYLSAQSALDGDTYGEKLLYNALEAPMRQIAKNAGKNDSDIVAGARKAGKGYNVITEKYEDLRKTGIVDPVKVTITALENAVNVAGLALITECLIGEFKDDKEPKPF